MKDAVAQVFSKFLFSSEEAGADKRRAFRACEDQVYVSDTGIPEMEKKSSSVRWTQQRLRA